MATTAHTKTVAREKRFNFFTIHFSLCSMALIRGLNMHMKTIRSKFLAGLLGLATSIAMVAMSAQAAQVLKPAYVSGATSAPATPSDINALTLTVPKGQYITFDVMYSVTAPNGDNESGLGLKVQYDSAFFDEMTADTLSAATPPALVTAGSYRTDVTNLLTKCMIASPSPQTISGTQREVVFGWIDTSIRRDVGGAPTGEVGWTGSADPAAPGAQYGCLNPGYPGASPAGGINGSTAAPAYSPTTGAGVKLFTMRLKVKSTATVGATSVVNITTGNNYSFANYASNNGFTPPSDKSFTISAAPAPAIAITGALSRLNHGATAGDRDVVVATAFGSALSGTSVASVTNAAAAGDTSITVEPRRGTGTSLNDYSVVLSFDAAVSSGTASVVSCLQRNGASAVACAAPPTTGTTSFSGSNATVALVGVPDQSRVRVRLANVNGSGVDAEMTLGFLIGDIQNDSATNTGDINQVKAASGTTVTSSSTNLRFDINRDGAINTGDINAVKAASGRRLP